MVQSTQLGNTDTELNPNNSANTLTSLQTSLLVSNTTANEFLTQIHQISMLGINATNALLEENLPKVLEYHLYLLQIGSKLERAHPDVFSHATVYYLPHIYHGYQSAYQAPEFEVNFSLEFKNFFEAVIVKVIGTKFETMLIALQDLRNQLNIENITVAFNLISTLTEAGIGQLTDFAYAAKARVIEDLNIYSNGPKSANNDNFKDIPTAIQQTLVNANSTLVKQIQAANYAMEVTLMVPPIQRIYTLEKLRIFEIATLPDIATILKRSAIILTQPTWSNLTARELKLVLLYGSPIPGYEHESEWLRDTLQRAFSNTILDYLLTNSFLNNVLSLPKMPCFKRIECLNFNEQEANLLKLENHYDALVNGQSISALHFEVLSTVSTGKVLSEVNGLGLVLGISFTIGLGAYLARSYGRIASFWGNALGLKKDKEDPVIVSNEYHPVPTTDSSHQLKLRQV
jgi:hypothetical protein